MVGSALKTQHADDPRALLDALLSGVAERIGRSAYRGCPFLNLATEFPDDKPSRPRRRPKQQGGIAGEARSHRRQARRRDPNRVASQIALLINGALVTGLMTEPADLRGDLVDAAMKLLA